MKKRPLHLISLTSLIAVFLIALSSLSVGASKDFAIVIGVDRVNGINDHLQGAANDARDFARQLERRGIKPVLLLNSGATKEAISNALVQGSRADHLVVYFAGFGSGPNLPRILTAESAKGWALKDLDQALLRAQAGSTTVILDTSFAGLRDSKDGPSLFTSRFYQPPSVNNSRALAAIGANASTIPGLSHDKICYITASRFNESAFEDTFDGQSQGIFTSYLCQRLERTQGPIAWSTIQWDVAAEVTAYVNDLQHPNFPQSYLANAALEGNTLAPLEYGTTKSLDIPGIETPTTPSGPTSPQHRTLWTLFNVDNVNPSLVSLQMTPNQSVVKVSEPLEFKLTVGKPGYLIVVEHSVEGTLMPIFPRNSQVATAKVRAGQTIIVPEPGVTAYADRSGRERLKALLFDDEEAAIALLAGLDTSDPAATSFGNASQRLRDRGIKFTRSVSSAEFGRESHINSIPITADLTFQVIEPQK